MRAVLLLIALALMLGFVREAAAQDAVLPHTIQAEIAGQTITFPLEISFPGLGPVPHAGSEGQVDVTVRANLSDLVAKIDVVMIAAGLGQPPGDYQSFNYNGTALAVVGDRLWCKYHFRIDVRNAPATNGSIEVSFRPMIEANAVRFAAEDIQLNISNDLARGAIRVLGLEDELVARIAGEVNGFLASPEAALQMPDILRAAETQLEAIRFAQEGGLPTLVAEGELRVTTELLVQLVQLLFAVKP